MELTLLEKLQLIAQRKDLTITQIATNMNMSKQSLSAKLKRKSFSIEEAEQLAKAIGCSLVIKIVDDNTNEEH